MKIKTPNYFVSIEHISYNCFMTNKKHLIFTIVVSTLALAMNAFIIVQACLNGDASTSSSGFLVNILKSFINFFNKETINEENIGAFTTVVRKLIGHFGFFALSGLLTSWSIYLISYYLKKYKPYMGIIFSLSFGLFLAGLTELIQAFVPDRSPQVTDVLIDFGGYILGAGLIILIIFLVLRKQENIDEEKVQ